MAGPDSVIGPHEAVGYILSHEQTQILDRRKGRTVCSPVCHEAALIGNLRRFDRLSVRKVVSRCYFC
ncbi:hypothetical protein ACQRIU_001978 [Beauveria bassiana]